MCIRDRPRWALISSKRARVRLLSCSRWRNFNSVVASGTDWRDRSMPTKSRSAWLSYSASSSASSARPYRCCRQYMRSMVVTPMGWRPTRPLLGYSGSMTAIRRVHGTMRSISPRNFSRRVRFFFIAYSALAKLRCDIGVLSLDSVLLRMHAPCRVRRIDQQFPKTRTDTHSKAALTLSLAALGIVFGDLGTSPLYALQEAFHGGRGVAPSPENVIGCLSLFLWSLIIMVSLKYVLVLMRADNHGEGGILALLALLVPDVSRTSPEPGGRPPLAALWILLALVGTAMLYGDGVITPAISVLSAVEGVSVATPAFNPYVVPLTVLILVGLFGVQAKGSGRVGAAFGPILAGWFGVIMILGIVSLTQTPRALSAFNPTAAYEFFERNGFKL